MLLESKVFLSSNFFHTNLPSFLEIQTLIKLFFNARGLKLDHFVIFNMLVPFLAFLQPIILWKVGHVLAYLQGAYWKLSLLSSCYRSSIKTIIYLKYFQHYNEKMPVCVSTEIKAFFWLACYFFQFFIVLPFFCLKVYYCFCMTFHDTQLNSMTFQAWKLK